LRVTSTSSHGHGHGHGPSQDEPEKNWWQNLKCSRRGASSSIAILVYFSEEPSFMSATPFKLVPVTLATAMVVGAMASTAAWAQSAPAGAASTEATYNIDLPAQPLGNALNELARQAGLQLLVRRELVEGKQAPQVSAQLTARQALNRVLANSGLVATTEGASVVIRPAPQPQSSESVLPTVTVTAGADSAPGQPPLPFAGGQVARGARIGVLGDRDLFEAPVSVVGFTTETVLNQQARTMAEVLRNDTSVKITQNTNSAGTDDVFNLRGFLSASSAATYDGLAGLIGRSQALEGIERVELLKGPTAFVAGSALFSAGGMINFVPKRATDAPITQLTTRYYSDSVLGLHADVGRRFGDSNQFGVRVNGAYRDGDTPIDEVSKKNEVLDVALDYRGERLRAYFNADYSKAATRNYVGGTGIAADVAVPEAPDSRNNWAQTWGFAYPQTKHRLAGRLEWDFNEDWMGSLAYGQLDLRDGEYTSCSPTIVNSAGDVSYEGDCFRGGTQIDNTSLDARLAGRFTTGAINHRLTFGTARTKAEYGGPFEAFVPAGQTVNNIYNPIRYPVPGNVPAIAANAYAKNYEERARSFYVSDEIGFMDDRLLVTLGLRHVDFEFGDFDPSTGQRSAPATEKGATTPFVGVVYKLTPDLSVFGNLAEALEQGSTAPNDASVDNPGQVLPPQTSKQQEVGLKFNAGSFAITTSLFQIEKENAVTVNRQFGYFGQQRNRGLEISVFGEPTNGFRVLSGLTYLKTQQRNTTVGTTEGKEAIGVPKLQVQLGGELDVFHWLPGMTLTGGIAHQSKQFVDNTNSRSIPAWTRLDAGLRYATRVSGTPTIFRLNIENLTDRNYWGSVDRGFLYVAQPRTLSLSATFDF
jgi:iron complex outermembrane receptor protein